jgi:hypothetical protein
MGNIWAGKVSLHHIRTVDGRAERHPIVALRHIIKELGMRGFGTNMEFVKAVSSGGYDLKEIRSGPR